MAYERPGWAGGPEPAYKMVNIDVGELIRTRDALTSAYLGLSASLDRAVKAYLDHTQVVLNGDAALNVGHLLTPFNALNNFNPASIAQMALQPNNGTVAPMMITNGLPPAPIVEPEEIDGKKKRKKRAYKQRDPNAPKRPLTAYFRYLGENRGAISKEIQDKPELFASSGKPGDISRVATDRWNALTREQQEPYRAAYQAALKEYEKEVERYKAAGGTAADLEDTVVDAAVAGAAAIAADADDSDDQEIVAPVVVEKTSKKAAPKKNRPSNVPPTPGFSSINPDAGATTIAPAALVASSSPERKRKSAAADAEPSAKKRRGKSNAAAEVVAAPDPIPAPVAPAVAPMVAAAPEVDAGGKKKKERKKKKDA